MQLNEMLSSLPSVRTVQGARNAIRAQLGKMNNKLVVIDDDPTGTQTMHDVDVYMDWDEDQLVPALTTQDTAFFVSTNSRSLSSEDAANVGKELGRNLRKAADKVGLGVLVASRSDSTLRGHFPLEVDALLDGMATPIDGIIIAPAFFEAGRYTINDIHWVDGPDGLIPASETEFARDPTFEYNSSDLKEWVEEKTGGTWKARDVVSLDLATIRDGGPEAVTDALMRVTDGQPVVLNAACYEDLEIAVLGLMAAESQGKKFVYRCAACFVKVRSGFEDKPLLTSQDLGLGGSPGLLLVGSYVQKTSRQLSHLLETGLVSAVELSAEELPGEGRENEILRVSKEVQHRLAAGDSAAVYTSRSIVEQGDFLKTGKSIMDGLCEVVRRIDTQPGFVVAKGGITSIEIARSGLGAKGARVLGQIVDGVPVWRLGKEARWADVPYVVFPGNVGNDQTLSGIFSALR